MIGAFESDTVAVFVRTAPISEHITSIHFLIARSGHGIQLFVHLDRITQPEGWVDLTAGSIHISPFDLVLSRR